MKKTFINYLYNVLPNNIKIQLAIFGISGNAIYSYGTYKTDSIQISKLYTYTNNSNSDFMIIDNHGNHYNISNSLWYWKWNSIEDWSKLKENDFINIKYYGYRIPIFGFFPNIYYSKKVDTLE
jgi:hypothetical protein